MSRPRAAVVVTGSELVRGERTDLNGPFLAREALRHGLEPARIAIVGDVPAELELRGVGKGSYVEVRQGSATGKIVLEATVPPGGVEKLSGASFYLYVRRPAGLRVRLGGKAVSLPARSNLRVVVTPERTTRLSG